MTRPAFSAIPSQHRIDAILAAVGLATGIDPTAIRSKTRDPRTVEARWMAWLLLEEAGFGLRVIARTWGHHHTSVRYAKERDFRYPPTREGGGVEHLGRGA